MAYATWQDMTQPFGNILYVLVWDVLIGRFIFRCVCALSYLKCNLHTILDLWNSFTLLEREDLMYINVYYYNAQVARSYIVYIDEVVFQITLVLELQHSHTHTHAWFGLFFGLHISTHTTQQGMLDFKRNCEQWWGNWDDPIEKCY